jgi:hypothetical protein
MNFKELDFIFPFVIFGYGGIVVFILNNPKLLALAEERMPHTLYEQIKARRPLGALCLIIGGLWSLQNLWLK